MILRRIEVRNLRCWEQPLVLSNLPSGLVVLAGDNEDGKSTLLEALRAAFFYRHSWSGERVEGLQPYGSSLKPEITVEFELDGRKYGIEKAFCKQKAATLRTPSGAFSNEEAEEKLAALLGASAQGRANQELESGPLGLLWIEQGEAWRAEVTRTGREGLRQALESEVGAVIGGPRAHAIAQAATAERDQLLTAKQDKPTGELKRAGEEEARLQQQCHSLTARLAERESLLQDLDTKRARLARLDEQHPEFVARKQRAEEAYAAVERRQRELEVLQQKVQNAQARLQAAGTQQQRQRGLCEQVGQRGAELSRRTDALQTATEASARTETALTAAVAEEQQCAAALSTVEAACDRLLQQRDRWQAGQELQELNRRLDATRAAQKEAVQKRAAAAAITVDDSVLAKLRKLDGEVQQAEAVLAAAATRIELHTAAGYTARIDGGGAVSDWTGTLDHRSRISIATEHSNVAEITADPFAAADPRQRRDRCRRALAEALGQHRAATLAEAEQQRERKRNAESDAQLAEATSRHHAPEGADALASRCEALRLRAGANPEATDGPPEPQAEAAAQEAVRVAREASQRSGQQAALAQQAADHARHQEAEARREETTAGERLAAAQVERNSSTVDEVRLGEQIAALQSECEALQRQLAEGSAAVTDLGPERLRTQRSMATQALEQLERERTDTGRAVEFSRGQLQAPEDWAEQLDEATLQLDSVTKRHSELRARAAALQLLTRVLADCRAQAQANYLAPVTQRLQPLLARLLPEAEIILDEQFAISGLSRRGRQEHFDRLSHGTREQLAILVRLAFAQLLREKGKPAITILDDAPAYADPQRFGVMLEILHAAAQSGQILILTCRPDDFRRSGATIVRLHASGNQSYGAHS